MESETEHETVQAAIRKAHELGDTPMIAVGLKLTVGLNDWMDAQVFRLKKDKVRKQDLLKRALQLLVIEIESGEVLADLD